GTANLGLKALRIRFEHARLHLELDVATGAGTGVLRQTDFLRDANGQFQGHGSFPRGFCSDSRSRAAPRRPVHRAAYHLELGLHESFKTSAVNRSSVKTAADEATVSVATDDRDIAIDEREGRTLRLPGKPLYAQIRSGPTGWRRRVDL